MFKFLPTLLLSVGLVSVWAPPASAQPSATVNSGGVLMASTGSQSFENLLNLVPGTTSGFSFSGSTGSFNQIANDCYYYAAYLFSFTPTSNLDTATITLNNPSGVTGLSERIYRYTGSMLLGDAPAGANQVQPWVAANPVAGLSLAQLNVPNLSGGVYVLEIRGHSVGNYAGSISFATPVPEPETLAMLLAGLGLLGAGGLGRRLVRRQTLG